MPGPLPATSGYTYAVEWSADEAMQANAKRVTFTPPLVSYVENFLDFEVGGSVPTGYYDRSQAAWIASENGRIVEILSVNGSGEAELDIDGSGQPASGAALTALGVTAGERRRIATLYTVGQSLWRTPIPHFTPWDHNWPWGPPEDAEHPNLKPKQPSNPPGSPSRTDLTPDSDGSVTDPCPTCGSVIDNENQSLGESVPIAGTPFTLVYHTDRHAQSRSARMNIPLSNATLHPGVKRIELEVLVQGQRYKETFSATPGLSTSFLWDGQSGSGQRRTGTHPATATVSYVYDGVYRTPADREQNFGLRLTWASRAIFRGARSS